MNLDTTAITYASDCHHNTDCCHHHHNSGCVHHHQQSHYLSIAAISVIIVIHYCWMCDMLKTDANGVIQ